ncbi:Glucosidase 2 subunit beta [Geodia barretti]|uniref:Glucosidase 2 subunit beta n=1 Tax=Geodia barretti TaxID=519541 RepID=A0AA35XH70_GEOBA|nr:Glucosidase 2 subunit beta [Geodia barretti]
MAVVVCVAVLSLLAVSSVECGGREYEVRGLDPRHKPRYHPGKDFTCLDGSDTISFSMVNDDYCDCEDGSDEPGTAACPTGGFYCRNVGHRPETILSSRVNDERIRFVRLDELKTEQERLKEEVDRLRGDKEAAEEPERLAKEEHEKRRKPLGKRPAKEAEARAAFEQLDTDSDGYVTVAEIQQRMELDDDQDGEVSLEEALAYLDNEERVDETVFKDSVWSFVSDKITFEPAETEPPTALPIQTDAPPTDDTGEKDYEEDYDYDEEDADYKDEERGEEGMPPYPDDTQELIKAADSAREAFQKVERELGDINREVGDIEKFLDVDLGSAMEFAPLHQQCYEYTDREYTYRLCAFDKVVQKPKNGGRETSLGTWVSWNGPEGSRYSSMLFENGEGCWNGPKRSTKVTVGCGLEEAVLAASEPNRCEYAMEFVTPAVCPPPPTPGTPVSHPDTPKPDSHQEL